MNILVTGGAGYIGSHTVVELIQHGLNPIIVDDFRNSEERILQGIERIVKRKVAVHKIDLSDQKAMRLLFEEYNFQGIIHFAAYKAVGESVVEPLKYYRNNVNTLLTVTELALEYNVNNFIFSSSCTLYEVPESNKVVTEATPIGMGTSPYATTKRIGEQILRDVVQSNPELKVLCMRYFNPVGAHPSGNIGELPQGRPNNLVPFITQTAMKRRDVLTVFGNDYNTPDGTCIRDYVHVCDIAEAHVVGIKWLIKQTEQTEEVVNLGTGEGKSVMDMIYAFEEVSEVSIDWKLGPRRSGDIEQIFADTTKAKELFKWSSKRSVEEALRDAWNWEMKCMNILDNRSHISGIAS
jgi:UDP-glucose 4-epimerase